MIRLLSKHSQLSRFFSRSSLHPLDKTDPQPSHPHHHPQTNDLSYLTSNLPTLNNKEITSLLSQFNSKPQFLPSEKKISLNLLQELSARLHNGQLALSQFIDIVQYLQICPESTKLLNSVLKQLLEPNRAYIAMPDLGKLIDLVFVTYKSTDYDLCKTAFDVLDRRISHNYSSSQLLDTMHTCLKMQSTREDLNEIVLKLLYFIQNKVELQAYEEHIKVLELYNDCEEIPRSLLNITFKYFEGMKLEDRRKMDTKLLMKALYEVSHLANNRNLYMSYHFKDLLMHELNSKLTEKDLDKVNYGVFFDAARVSNAVVPSKVVDCVEKHFITQKVIDYSYVLCYINLIESRKVEVRREIEEKEKGEEGQERSLKELPTSEILKIFNASVNLKQNPFLKRINSLTHKM